MEETIEGLKVKLGMQHQFYLLAMERADKAEADLAIIQAQEEKLGQALEEIVCAHSMLKQETYSEYSLKTALRALGR